MKNGDVCTVDCVREHLPILGNWKVTSVSGVKEHLIATGTKVLSIRLILEIFGRKSGLLAGKALPLIE